jgi:CheY-like chemotaxis protein
VLGLSGERNLPTVLLIDDDEISRELIAMLLTLNGYTLHAAADGAAALQLLDRGNCAPQVILVDVQMEGLNGVALVKELRARTPARICAISGSAPPQDVRAAVDGFFQKPFSPESLQTLLDEQKPKQEAPKLDSDEVVVNQEILSQFRQMMAESAVREVYFAVVADLKKRTGLLEAAIAEGDANAVRRIGHAIKGGCGMAGARQAAHLGELFETESDELSDSAALLRKLRDAQQNLERMLEIEFRS